MNDHDNIAWLDANGIRTDHGSFTSWLFDTTTEDPFMVTEAVGSPGCWEAYCGSVELVTAAFATPEGAVGAARRLVVAGRNGEAGWSRVSAGRVFAYLPGGATLAVERDATDDTCRAEWDARNEDLRVTTLWASTVTEALGWLPDALDDAAARLTRSAAILRGGR